MLNRNVSPSCLVGRLQCQRREWESPHLCFWKASARVTPNASKSINWEKSENWLVTSGWATEMGRSWAACWGSISVAGTRSWTGKFVVGDCSLRLRPMSGCCCWGGACPPAPIVVFISMHCTLGQPRKIQGYRCDPCVCPLVFCCPAVFCQTSSSY